MKVAGTGGDFLALEYAAADAMYVPVSASTWSSATSAATARSPSSTARQRFMDRVKRRTKEAVLAMASELLDIYAAREVMEGHALPIRAPPTPNSPRASNSRRLPTSSPRSTRSCATCAGPSRWTA